MPKHVMGRREFLRLAATGSTVIAIPACTNGAAPGLSSTQDRSAARPQSMPATGGAGTGGAPTGGAAATGGATGGVSTATDAGPFDSSAAGKRPNVLFVFDDQLRTDVCGVYGGRNITTPNIDRLAREGVIFTNSVSSCPLCTPYRGMLQTGRYPTHSGLIMNWVDANHTQNPHCLADVFGAAGYQTSFIGKWHLTSGAHRQTGLYEHDDAAAAAYRAKNPETEYVPPGPTRLGFQHWQAYNFHVNFNDYYWYEDTPERLYSGRYETDTQIDQAIAQMEKCRQAGSPFLVCVAPHPPHPPFDPAFLPEGYLDQVPQSIRWSPNVPADKPRSDTEMRYYLAMAKNMDDNLGRLMDYLEDSGLAEDTIVVFTSDHGEMHGSHGRTNKMVPYTEAVSIPLIMRWPKRIAPGLRLDTLQTPMDHLPTLCGLAGLAIPEEVDGEDLSEVVLGRGQDDRDAVLIGNYTSHWDFLQTGTLWPEWRGVITKQYTFCRWLTGSEELYDNLADPFQMNNLASDRSSSAVLDRLRARLWELLAVAHDDFRPGPAYGDWYDNERNLVATALGPVPA